jgi:hypothetical protein
MSAQILDVEEDLLDLQLRYVEEDIRLCRRLSAMTMPAGVALSRRQLAGAQGFVFHASPSGTRTAPNVLPAMSAAGGCEPQALGQFDIGPTGEVDRSGPGRQTRPDSQFN